jgi:multiple sugar transport system substrate-binding protein
MTAIRHRCLAMLCSAVAAVTLGACFGGDDQPPGPPVPQPPKDAKIADVALMHTATGTVHYCTDPSAARKEAVRRFNGAFASRGLSARITALPADSREQRRLFLQRAVACDVYDSDVVWMAEWASRGRVYNMRRYLQDVARRGREWQFIPNTLKTVEFAGRPWGVPHTTNAGLLFYRSRAGLTRRDRATWKGVYRSAKRAGGITYQGAQPEPLTVNFLEIAFAAGGRVLSRDGRRSVVDSPENLDALRFMVDGVKDGTARDVLTADEHDSMTAFVNGATFMRNWPDKFGRLKTTRIKGQYDVAPLPIFDGAGVAGVLGGADLVIDSRSRNPGGALALIDFLIGPRQQERGLTRYAEPAVLTATYENPALRASVPFAEELFRAIRQGRPRPVTPAYDAISDAISSNVHAALSDPGGVSPKQALERMRADIDKALAAASAG